MSNNNKTISLVLATILGFSSTAIAADLQRSRLSINTPSLADRSPLNAPILLAQFNAGDTVYVKHSSGVWYLGTVQSHDSSSGVYEVLFAINGRSTVESFSASDVISKEQAMQQRITDGSPVTAEQPSTTAEGTALPESERANTNTSPPQQTVTAQPNACPDPSDPVDPCNVNISQLERAILNEVNQARQNPQQYAEKLASLKQYYKGTGRSEAFHLPGEDPFWSGMGGGRAQHEQDLDEAIAALRGMQPLSTLQPSDGLRKAALDHAKDPSIGSDGHTGSDGSSVFDRAKRYGVQAVNESVAANHLTALGYVTAFLVDHQVPSRGHRKNLLSPDATQMGVGCHYHAPSDPSEYGFLRCVLVGGR